MEINGLPLHPLIVHAAVIFGPLASLVALAYVGLPKYRDRLRWATLVMVLIATGAIWAAWLSGSDFYEGDRFASVSGDLKEKIDHHMDLAGNLRLITSAFAIVTVLATWLHTRTGALRYVLGALVAVGALATLIWTVLTGDAGSRAVWGS